jgi:outer membrane protein TolC
MPRSLSTIFGAALVMACGSALAQSGDLAGVTMRVLDDVSDVHKVVLELHANRGDEEAAAESDGRRANADEAASADSEAPGARADEERRDADALHHPDDDERSEGKLEDNDVERPAVPPTP